MLTAFYGNVAAYMFMDGAPKPDGLGTVPGYEGYEWNGGYVVNVGVDAYVLCETPDGVPLPTIQQGLVHSSTNNKCFSVDATALDGNPANSYIRPRDCDMSDTHQVFLYRAGFLVHKASGLCLSDNGDHIALISCQDSSDAKLRSWDFKNVNAGDQLATRQDTPFCAFERSDLYDTIPCSGAGTQYSAITEEFEFLELTEAPTSSPTDSPTNSPTDAPIKPPTDAPTKSPSQAPKAAATLVGSPGGSGDPHFTTFDGYKFDFHGGCDLVLLQNPSFANGLGMNIHIRTEISSWWSFIKSAVVQIGDDTLEIEGGKRSKYWMNGKEGVELKTGDFLHLSGFSVHFRKVNDHQQRYRINLSQGDGVSIEVFKNFVRVDLRAAKKANFGNSAGLLGSFPEGKMFARDGTTIMEDTDSFAKEWQVLASEPMIFHTIEGVQHPQQCAMPQMSQTKRRLGESLITKEEASTACEHVGAAQKDDCIFDVLATNDKEMAGSY